MTDLGRNTAGTGPAAKLDAPTLPATDAPGAGVDVPRVALLGLNLWAVVLAIPIGHWSGHTTPLGWLLVGAPLGLLVAGVYALARQHIPQVAQEKTTPPGIGAAARASSTIGAMWLLIAGFPSALAAVIASRAELRDLGAASPLDLAIACVSLAAFGGAAAAAVSRPRATRRTTRQPLAAPPDPVPGATTRTTARRVLLGVGAVGALALVAIAPTLGGRAGLEQAWGEGAAEGALLASVAGSTLATLVLSVFIGPGLRAARARPAKRPSVQRVLLSVLLVAGGAISAYLVYQRAR